jgi:hypothetical protein
MSAIASFIKIPSSSLGRLREAADGAGDDYNALLAEGVAVAEYSGSGYVLGTVLPYLKEQHQIDLMHSEHADLGKLLTESTGATHFILTPAQRAAYLDKLGPALFSETEMRDYFNEFYETNENDVGKTMLDGIAAFRQSLSQLDDASIIVFVIA